MKAYRDWANRVRFEYCDLTIPSPEDSTEDGVPPEDRIPHYKFFYNNEARSIVNADMPKRSLAIAKEVNRPQDRVGISLNICGISR